MEGIFFNPIAQEDLEYDGFFDGQNKVIPEGYETEVTVFDGFVGIEEGKSQQVCMINVKITDKSSEFYGQKYRYNAKIYDMDASKRDLAMKNLGVLDAQAGFPMTNQRLQLNTETIQAYWANRSTARVKFGLLVSEDDGREINFIRGFAYIREKMVQQGQQQAPQQQAQQVQQVQQVQQQSQYDDQDIDF